MFFVLLDLGRLVHLVPKAWLVSNGWASLCVLATIAGIFIYGNIHYKHKVRQPLGLTTEKHLDKDLKIVMVSDLHLGYHNRRADFAKWVDIINAEKPDLILIGRDDRSNPKRKNLDDLMNGTADSLYTILLGHQPYHLEEAENHGVDFQFSGHTHRGQIWPASWIADRLFEDSWG